MIVLLQASKSNTEEKQRFIWLQISQKWLKTMHITADQQVQGYKEISPPRKILTKWKIELTGLIKSCRRKGRVET